MTANCSVGRQILYQVLQKDPDLVIQSFKQFQKELNETDAKIAKLQENLPFQPGTIIEAYDYPTFQFKKTEYASSSLPIDDEEAKRIKNNHCAGTLIPSLIANILQSNLIQHKALQDFIRYKTESGKWEHFYNKIETKTFLSCEAKDKVELEKKRTKFKPIKDNFPQTFAKQFKYVDLQALLTALNDSSKTPTLPEIHDFKNKQPNLEEIKSRFKTLISALLKKEVSLELFEKNKIEYCEWNFLRVWFLDINSLFMQFRDVYFDDELTTWTSYVSEQNKKIEADQKRIDEQEKSLISKNPSGSSKPNNNSDKKPNPSENSPSKKSFFKSLFSCFASCWRSFVNWISALFK